MSEGIRVAINLNRMEIDHWFDENGVGWHSEKELRPDGEVIREEVRPTGMRIFWEEPDPTFLMRIIRRLTLKTKRDSAPCIGIRRV